MSSTKYIGMDVHKESISIAVMNAVVKIVMECVIETKASMKYQPEKSSPCVKHASLRSHPMPPWTIEESHRPRFSNRTMHCHSSSGQSSGLLFQKMIGVVTIVKWNQGKRNARLRFVRGDKPELLT